MIALPFATTESGGLPYRLLLNQYNETLDFTFVDKGVPNRGVDDTFTKTMDQLVVTLDYQQVIRQVAAVDRPESTPAGPTDLPIHHEPGLFLNMINFTEAGLDVARRLQYLQVVNLEFFPRTDGLAGRIGWPHVSINTLERWRGKPFLGERPECEGQRSGLVVAAVPCVPLGASMPTKPPAMVASIVASDSGKFRPW